MASKRHRDFPILDKNGCYLGMISRRNLLGAKGKQVILVDHNEKNQAVAGVEGAEILEIIDHHRLGTVQTMAPVFFRNQPLGCTATIIYQMYRAEDCRPAVQRHHFRYATVPFSHLYFRGRAGGQGTGSDRGSGH